MVDRFSGAEPSAVSRQRPVQYPNREFEHTCLERRIVCLTLWEMRGPPRTAIKWIVAYSVRGHVVIVQTFRNGGWDVYTSSPSNRIDESIDDALARCKVS